MAESTLCQLAKEGNFDIIPLGAVAAARATGTKKGNTQKGKICPLARETKSIVVRVGRRSLCGDSILLAGFHSSPLTRKPVVMDEIKAGTKIHQYIVGQLIGEGGAGAVYRAQVENLGRKVALKIFLPIFSQDTEAIIRFKREASASAQLNHPNIIPVYDFGKFGETYYLTMPLLEEGSLADRLIEGPLAVADGVEYALQVCQGLLVAHEAGIIHRDIKPENILFYKGRVALADFGLSFRKEDPSLTMAGSRVGTPIYMSPEQAKGLTSDERTDIYAVGLLLYEMLSGKLPFPEDIGCAQLMSQIIKGEGIPLEKRLSLPGDLEYIIKKCMHTRKVMRHQTVQDLIRDLQSFQQGVPLKKTGPSEGTKTSRRLSMYKKNQREASPLPLILTAFGAVLVVVLLVFLMTSSKSTRTASLQKKKKAYPFNKGEQKGTGSFSLPKKDPPIKRDPLSITPLNDPNKKNVNGTGETNNPLEEDPLIERDPIFQQDPLIKKDPFNPDPKNPSRKLWTPVLGGEWKVDKNLIIGTGRGMGEFSLACLRHSSKVYRYFELSVKLQMLSGTPGRYAGVFITEKDDYNKGLIYIADDDSVFQRYAQQDPEGYKKLIAQVGKDVKILRFAFYLQGRWKHLRDVILSFKRGSWVELKVRHYRGLLTVWVNGQKAAEMKTQPFEGSLGLIKYYDAEVKYRDFQVRELR